MLIITFVPHTFSSFELASFLITVSSRTILTCLIHWPPNTALCLFRQELSLLCAFLNNKDECLLLGDFNVPYSSDWSFLSDFSLFQHVQEPTHNKGNILDLIFTRSDFTVLSNLSCTDGLSDHVAVLFTLPCLAPSLLSNTLIHTRSYKRIDHDRLANDLYLLLTKIFIKWETSVFGQSTLTRDVHDLSEFNCENAVCFYDDTLRKVLDQHAPLWSFRSRVRSSLPWFNASLRLRKRKLRLFERAWRSSKSDSDRSLYVTAKTGYHAAIDSARRDNIRSAIEQAEQEEKP